MGHHLISPLSFQVLRRDEAPARGLRPLLRHLRHQRRLREDEEDRRLPVAADDRGGRGGVNEKNSLLLSL